MFNVQQRQFLQATSNDFNNTNDQTSNILQQHSNTRRFHIDSRRHLLTDTQYTHSYMQRNFTTYTGR